MKNSFLILLYTLVGCSNSATEADNNSAEGLYADTGKYTVRCDSCVSIADSGNYHILKETYPTGVKFREIYENKEDGLGSVKQFYETGQLQMQGKRTNGSFIKVGNWQYYSLTGIIDSTVNYDKQHHISYANALRIAKSKKIPISNPEVKLRFIQKHLFWQISWWIESISEDFQDGILIHTETGKVFRCPINLISPNISDGYSRNFDLNNPLLNDTL